jgi:hypothetical protein
MKKSGTPTASIGNGNTGVQISTASYGKAVKLIYGMCKTAPDLIWYNGWQRLGNPSNALLASITGQGQSKKQSKKSNTTFYSAAMDFVLGHAPILGVMSMWVNNQLFMVFKASASGFVSGGQFTFVPSGGLTEVGFEYTVAGPPYTVTVANFVADCAVQDLTLGGNATPPFPFLQPGTYLGRSDPANPPGPLQYTVNPSTGLYTFNAAQAGNFLSIQYFKTTGGSPATLVNIFAATVHEEFTATFNDFGAPGSETIYGTWERPLWNSAFAVPGRIDAGAYAARDPYSWSWDGVNPTVHFPAGLNGKPVTVYYGVPAILNSLGGTIRDASLGTLLTPLEIMNLEFEPILGSGSEYAGFAGQQVEQDWCCGLGSPQYDLGTANTPPSLNVETIGTFTQWPNGDADVADIIADIVASGPVIVA